MVRTLNNELEFNCQMQKPLKSKTSAWIFEHATTLLNLDSVGSLVKIPFRCVFGERVCYRVGLLPARTKAKQSMESGILFGPK